VHTYRHPHVELHDVCSVYEASCENSSFTKAELAETVRSRLHCGCGDIAARLNRKCCAVVAMSGTSTTTSADAINTININVNVVVVIVIISTSTIISQKQKEVLESIRCRTTSCDTLPLSHALSGGGGESPPQSAPGRPTCSSRGVLSPTIFRGQATAPAQSGHNTRCART